MANVKCDHSKICEQLCARWQLSIGVPISQGSGACLSFATRRDGTAAVLKIVSPHMEAEDEALGLQFWNGDGAVRLLECDESLHALLLERCEPGVPLRASADESSQDEIIAGLLRRLWRRPPPTLPFRRLRAMIDHWVTEVRAAEHSWDDSTLVEDGLAVFDQLSRPLPDDVLLTTDLHAGNVLRAQREPWLAIDPKPFIGDRAYDLTQHLLNCPARLTSSPLAIVGRLAALTDTDPVRVRHWLFARLATSVGQPWSKDDAALARALA